jgi:uncharacterized protein
MKACKINLDKKKGRGVFAAEPIQKGEVIEECELIIMPELENTHTISRYAFQYDKKKIAIALGNGCLYNHAEVPNASCYLDPRRKKIIFEACRAIKAKEEIQINYGYSKQEKKLFQIE